MTKYLRCASGLLTLLICVSVQAQFYTVSFVNPNIDTLYKSKDPYAKLGRNPPDSNYGTKKSVENASENIPLQASKASKMLKFEPLTLTDSLFIELIKKRLNICLPLDYISYSSSYGYRKDPFERCRKFHDGIDMRCKHELAYCMLPGKVVKVKLSKTGYGNHVIVEHGRLRTLYGHLEEVYVREGTEIDAGTVFGLTGSSGRSTGYHLHLALHKLDGRGQWTSVNPQPFIETLNDYINELGEGLRRLQGIESPTPIKEAKPLTIANLYEEIRRQGLKFPKIVLAQALLESGNFSSRLAREQNNLFGLRLRNGSYASFDHWSESVTAYRDWVQYKHRPKEDYYVFLSRIRYATMKGYIYKVKEIVRQL